MISPVERPLRILFAAPAYWPAIEFGGPIWMARELMEGMVARGHQVDVVTTGLATLGRQRARGATVREVEGVRVHYLWTPVRYRWMGVTPMLPRTLGRLPRPDVAHVFGFRDPLGTLTAAWCRRQGVPYIFEPLGMFRRRLRKLRLKRVIDATVGRGVAAGAALVVTTSELERADLVAGGIAPERVIVRGNGFPPPLPAGAGSGELRALVGLDGDSRIVLYSGRIGRGKGIELLLDAARRIEGAHFVFVGPDGRDGTSADVAAASRRQETVGRIHLLPPQGAERPLTLYEDADVFALPSAGESFGMVAAEAAAAGTPLLLTDRCGVAEFVRDRAALVVPYDARAVTAALQRLLADRELRERLGAGGREVAAELSWGQIVERQEAIYDDALARSAARESGQ
jgi:glycosyltransferase involved in cell wall biosynthesis